MPVPAGSDLSPRVRIRAEADSPRASIVVGTDDGVLSCLLDGGGPRLRVGLALAPRLRPVDVSDRPLVLVAEVDGPESSALARWVAAFCQAHGLWAGGGDDLARALGGASFPVLGALYDRGAATLAELPRWASPILAERRAPEAARCAFGHTSRRVVAALGSSLQGTGAPGAPPNLYPLALAMMGRPVLAPDATVRVLHAGADGSTTDPTRWPTVDEIVRFEHLAPGLGGRRVERLLTDAATLPDGDRLLTRTATLLAGLPSGARLRLPMGLGALHDRCRDLTPIDPGLRQPVRALPGRGPARPPRPAAPPRPRPAPRTPAHALRAPVETRRPPSGLLEHPPEVAGLHGRVPAPRLRLVVPRSTDELRQWGLRLNNCLGSFATAATYGRSVLIGVERDDQLTYCVEVTPSSRTVRQLLGAYNRAVPASVAGAVVTTLITAQVVDPHHPVNRPWVALCGATPSGGAVWQSWPVQAGRGHRVTR